MADITKAKEVVKETLLGSETAGDGDMQLSAQSKATFDKNATKDEESGEVYMGEEEFINAIAPETEDYVSASCEGANRAWINWLTTSVNTA